MDMVFFMATLHEIDEPKVYCGPAALMAITGERLPVVRSAINKARGFADNQGVIRLKIEILEKAMSLLGVRYVKCIPSASITLGGLAKQLSQDTRYIIAVTGHYVTYLNGVVVDNHTRFGTPIAECKWARKTVVVYFQVD